MHGMHCIKTWSSTQAIIALSSAEAEYYGIVKAASQGIGIKSLCADFDCKVALEILTDASAARSIANRMGLGKVRHIDTHFLWVQQRVHRGDFTVSKVWGKENPADLLTKFLDTNNLIKAMSMFNVTYLSGRAAEAPQLAQLAIDASPIRGIRQARLHNPSRIKVEPNSTQDETLDPCVGQVKRRTSPCRECPHGTSRAWGGTGVLWRGNASTWLP